MDKILSIIIPTYNMEKYLDRCLSSLIVDDNLMSELEVLVINDGSKDRSSEIAHGYANRYPDTFIVVDKENGHYGSCVNKGLELASGKYVKVLDADDWFENENIKDYLSFLENIDVDMVLTRSNVGEPGNTSEYHSCSLPEKTVVGIKELIESNLCCLPHQCLTYRTELLRSIEYKQTEKLPYTDLEWDLYPLRAVNKIVYYPHILYVYYLGRAEQSVSPEVHAREMVKDNLIVEKAVAYYEGCKGSAKVDNLSVMKKVVSSNVERIYFHYLINIPHLLKNSDLVVFDENIKRISPEIYASVDSATERRKFLTFNYIQIWRRHMSRRSLTYLYFDLGVLAGRLLHRK